VNQDYATSKEQLKNAEEGNQYYDLLSVAPGKVYQVFKKTGDMVRRGEQVAQIGNPDSIVINLDVDEGTIVKVKLGQPVLNPKFENWEETAALLANVDGVVTTDNGAGWLAQALGLRCSILLSGNSDWKFLRGPEKSYWSAKARVFRNSGQGFENCVDKIIAAIRNGEGVGRAV
jgi:hypothetical protein